MHWIPKINTAPEKFIDDFMGAQFGERHTQDKFREKFKNGYCYYFAHMLKLAFNRGEVCWAAPNSHFVWVDDDGIAYDIDGKYNLSANKCMYLIPEKDTEDFVEDFLKTSQHWTERKYVKELIQKYCEKVHVAFLPGIEDEIMD